MRGIAILFSAVALFATAAEVRFAPDCSLEVSRWRTANPDWLEGQCPLTLSVNGLQHERSGIVLLFGDLSAAQGSYRSTMLRSVNGGTTWEEVMSPALASSVVAISFADSETGFALVGWVVEGPGELWVHRTPDAGETWLLVAEISKPHTLDLPTRLECATPLRCTVMLECGLSRRRHLLATLDGGRTWRSRGSGRLNAAPARSAGWTAVPIIETDETLRIERRGLTPNPTVLLPRFFRRAPDGDFESCSLEMR